MGYTFEDIINNPSEGPIVILVLVTIPLCIVATILRLVATKRSRRKFGWDDLFAVLALLAFLVYAFTPIVGVAAAGNLDDDGVAILAAKLSYVAAPFFSVNQLFAKASLFVLYYRIFWSDRTFARWVYTLTTIHVCWFITFFFALVFLCNPISKWWDVSGTEPGHCLDENAYLVAEETINSSMDFAMIALTVFVVRKLQTRTHIKSKLAFIFVVGGLSGVTGFVKIGIVYNAPNDYGGEWLLSLLSNTFMILTEWIFNDTEENTTNAFWDLLGPSADGNKYLLRLRTNV
ncbi:hypothetical protein VP1G_05331 [Cytospora mali]|uniref:Rhodopsin domain-containing protein n=1 Tax=Cytospora mali TaxID=578113 RepID=A0A194V227_CYTMA|nr:hypothetical protein VP1G_05331 [Valsa mali var. pyri (nom. inval.)]